MPGTGPYKIVSISPTEIRFVRNPFFHEWSHAAQPDGNPNSIVWRAVPSTHDAVTAIEQGRADWLFGQIPPHAYHQLELQDPAQLHSNPQPLVDFARVLTRTSPRSTTSASGRRSTTRSTETRSSSSTAGQASPSPTCQPIAPGIPGYKRYCPYTLHPTRERRLHRARHARARQLVAESGTRGEQSTCWAAPTSTFPPPQSPRTSPQCCARSATASITYLVPFDQIMQMGVAPQIAVNGDLEPGYPDPSSYISSFLSCGGGSNWGGYCNPAVDREMQQAEGSSSRTRPKREPSGKPSTGSSPTPPPGSQPSPTQKSNSPPADFTTTNTTRVWGFLADQSWVR